MKLRNNIILIFTIILLGCGENKKTSSNRNEQEPSKIIEKVDTSIVEKEIEEPNTQSESQLNDNSLKITFEEFSIEVDNIEIWEEGGKLKGQQKDTVRIYLDLGETIEGRILKIQEIKKVDLRIYQRFENSVTVTNEGPHCDLIEWKHFDSDWKELKIENGRFLTDKYSEADKKKFIEIDIAELQEAVRKQCGDRWAKLVKDIKSPTEYPCGVDTSRIYFKIEFIEQDSKDLKERIISFEFAMGG